MARSGVDPDSLWTLAQNLLGTRDKWPQIFNRNRKTFRRETEVHAGACIYIPTTTGRHTDSCTGLVSDITGLLDSDRRARAARALGVDWWSLTEQSIEAVTLKRTGFIEGNVHPQADRLFGPTADAVLLAWLDGAEPVPSGSASYAVYKGSDRSISVPYVGEMRLPFAGAWATTIGAIMFVDDAARARDPFLIGHEYIHVMQYAGTRNQEGIYLGECAQLGSDCGKANQPSEAMAYLWTTWLENYYQFGGPTHTLPQNKWHTPTLKQIWDAKPWYVLWPDWVPWP